MEKKVRYPKVLDSKYLVKVNGETAVSKDTLKDANFYVNSLVVTDVVERVEVVRQTITETVINTFTPEVKRVLVTADDLGADFEELA